MNTRIRINNATRTGTRKNLGETVFERLTHAIKSGAYAQEERLPTEHDLAAEFEVSRPVVREALKRLRDQGLIYSRRGSGSYVRSPGVRHPLGFGAIQSISDLERCYEFRITIEPDGAAAAARRHDEGSLATIADALALMRSATDRQLHRDDADFQFHLSIMQASENPYFATAMESLKEHIAVGMQFHGQSLKISPNGLAEVYDEHDQVYQAIRDGAAERAHDLMRAHLIKSRERLFEGR